VSASAFTESVVELAALAWLESAGWSVKNGTEVAPGEPPAERADYGQVVLEQEQMSQLFGRERSVITKHVRNVFREGDLEPGATCAKFAQVE